MAEALYAPVMRNGLRGALLVLMVMLASCSRNTPPPDLPLVVTETGPQGTVQVTVDPEGTTFTNRRGETTRREFPRSEIAELRQLMIDADLAGLDGSASTSPRYIILAGDVEIFLGQNDVPKRLIPVLERIEERRA